MYAWGANANGQLGINSTTKSMVPIQVLGLGGTGTLGSIKAVTCGTTAAYALGTNGLVYAWGNDANGELGNGSSGSQSLVPVQVLGVGGTGNISYVKQIAAGSDFGLGLVAEGNAYGYGGNTNGDLGNGSTAMSTTPVEVCAVGGCTGYLGSLKAIAGSMGYTTGLALDSTGTAYGWGSNAYGNAGSGSTTSSTIPVAVVSPTGTGTLAEVTAISGGGAMSSAIAPPTAACSGGILSISVPATITFPGTTLSGVATTSVLTVPVTATDLSDTGAGWNISASASGVFTAGARTLPSNATSLTASSATALASTCTLPINTIAPSVPLSTSGVAAANFNAQPNSGTGSSTINLTYTIAIPAGALPGSYSSSWTIAISSGP